MAKHLVSPIVYMGSKRRLMEQLMDEFPGGIDTFYDVFGGSGTVALNAPSQHVLLNEFNTPVYQMHEYFIHTPFIEIQQDMQDLVVKYGDGKKLTEQQFKDLRDIYNKPQPEDRDVKILHLLVYFSFQKMFRFNQDGGFNTSFNNRVKSLPNRDYFSKLYSYSEVLLSKGVQLQNKDFRDIDYTALTSQDFVYFDPPYLITEAMYNTGWGEQDDRDLYQLIQELDSRGIRFGLSNVIHHKGRTNHILKEFAEDPKYHVHRFNIVYDAYLGDKGVADVADEVYITNVASHEVAPLLKF